jgi:hypothetical protein
LIKNYSTLLTETGTFSIAEQVLIDIAHERINLALTQLFEVDLYEYTFRIESKIFWNFNEKMLEKIVTDCEAAWDIVEITKYEEPSETGATILYGLEFRLVENS